MYYIYHIPGKKIGVTTKPKRRIREQNFNQYEILEIHEDIFIVSTREIELQIQYGYRVDTEPYYITVNKLNKNRSLGGSISRPPKHQIGKRKLTREEVIDIRTKYASNKNSSPIALEYKLTRAAILKIVRKETYNDIE